MDSFDSPSTALLGCNSSGLSAKKTQYWNQSEQVSKGSISILHFISEYKL